MSPMALLARFGRKSILKTPVKAEVNEVEEDDSAVCSAPRAPSTPRTSLKRSRSYHAYVESKNKDKGDVQPKAELSDDDGLPSLEDFCNPAKRRRYLDDDDPSPHRHSTGSGAPAGKESVGDPSNAGSDYEDLEESGSSDNEYNESNLSVSPQASSTQTKEEKMKKTRQNPVSCAETWWKRFYDTQTKLSKSRSHRNFAKGGAEAKLQSMMNHDPLAGKDSKRDGEPTQYIDASNKSKWFKMLSDLVLPQECRGDPSSLKIASEGFGYGKIKGLNPEQDKSLHKTTWLLQGMKTSLWHHQLLGVHWMMGREFCIEGPKGGINADAMGLGKTVEMLAAIVANPRPESAIDQKIGPTLIVCPACIVDQWQSEIEKHLADNMYQNVLVFKSGLGLKEANLISAGIVLASYQQVRMSCPWPSYCVLRRLKTQTASKGNKPPTCPTAVEDWIEENREKGELLHKIFWHRVVLDEAQNIKNEAVRTSHAANALLGKYRWAMSGTPMMNRREELYPYFRFIKDPAIKDLYMFTQEFCENNKECNKRINETLGRIILRRTMTDRILGKKIVELPPFTKMNNVILFNKATEVLYRAVEERFRDLVKEVLDNDDPRKKLQYSIVAVLRLRQFTAHPLIIEPQMKIMFDIKELKAIQKQMDGADFALHHRINLWIRDLECGSESPKSFKFEDTDECGLCNEVEIEDAQQVRTCKNRHIFCRPCIEQYCAAQAATDEVDDGKMKCPATSCTGTFEFDRIKYVKGNHKERSSRQEKGRDVLKYVPSLGARSEWLEDMVAGKFNPPQSTKLAAIRKKLQKWREKVPSDKTVIFVQWKAMILLIGLMLEEENFQFVYYTGDMNKRRRATAMEKFANIPEVTVMVMGLHVGGVGLNITCANRAIMVDLWWNQAVEMQAYARIYRIGQTKNTNFRRQIIRRSVDVRLALNQMRKNALIAGTCKALGEHGQMSALGRVIEDEDGNPIDIIADYEALDKSEILTLLEEGDNDMDRPGVFHNPEHRMSADQESVRELAVDDDANPKIAAKVDHFDENDLMRALRGEMRAQKQTADDDDDDDDDDEFLEI